MRDLRRIFPLAILAHLARLLRGSLAIIPLAVEILLLAQMTTFFASLWSQPIYATA